MTTVQAPLPSPTQRWAIPGGRNMRLLWFALLAVLLLSISRIVTDANDLTSSGAFGAALRLAVPVGLAGLGGLYAERAGVVNIGLEGMMVLGTFGAGWAGYEIGGWWGLLVGIGFGALGGLLHALATVTFGVDQIVSGVAINIIAPGITRFLASELFSGTPGASATSGPNVDRIGRVSVPFLAGQDLFGWKSPDMLRWFEDEEWFFVSDLAGILRGFMVNLSWITVISVLLVPLSVIVLWRTPFGLRLRSCGEDPVAAESLGVNVYRMKTIAVVVSGALAGLGGAILVLFASIYREGQTAGRGFIGLAAMIFGNWRPGGLAMGAGLFGFTDALQLRNEAAVHAMLLFVAALLAALGVRALVRSRLVPGAVMLAFAAGFLAWWLMTDEYPKQWVPFTPHITTLLVLAFASQRLRMPAADGVVYRRGEGR